MIINNESYESVIPTAILTAYPRTLTDIPFSKEIFKELDEELVTENLKKDILAPELEARFKLTSDLLHKSKIKQVLELASGYSTRGLELTKDNDAFTYVELDLDEVAKRKKQIISTFTDIPNNLHILSGNALDKEVFKNIEKYFDCNNELAIINEGLLRYLDFDEKKKVANNIHMLLKKCGGIWITCDVTPKKFITNQDLNIQDFNKNLSSISGRNNSSWRFENIEQVKEFYGNIGFSVEEIHPFIEIKEQLSSPSKLNLNDEDVERLLLDAIVVVMKLK